MSSCNCKRYGCNNRRLYHIGFECQVATSSYISSWLNILYHIGFECQVATAKDFKALANILYHIGFECQVATGCVID